MSDKLSDQERKEDLAPLLQNGWDMVDGRDAITKRFTFRNFVDAFGWMTRAAIWARNTLVKHILTILAKTTDGIQVPHIYVPILPICHTPFSPYFSI